MLKYGRSYIEVDRNNRANKASAKQKKCFKKIYRLWEEIYLKWMKKLKECNHSLSDSVEAFLEAIDIFWKIIQLEYRSFIEISVDSTVEKLVDLGFYDGFDNNDEIFKNKLNFDKNRNGQLKKDQWWHFFSSVFFLIQKNHIKNKEKLRKSTKKNMKDGSFTTEGREFLLDPTRVHSRSNIWRNTNFFW